MARKGMLEVEGTVQKLQGGGFYRVAIDDTDKSVLATLSGRLRQFRIRVLPGDKVRLEIPEEDTEKGFIVYRM